MGDSVKPEVKSAEKKPNKRPKNRNKSQQGKGCRDFYVSDSTPFPIQVENCEQLLEKEGEIFVHGVGPLICCAINLALQIEAGHPEGTLRTKTTTSTVDTIDEFGDRRPGSEVSIRILRA